MWENTKHGNADCFIIHLTGITLRSELEECRSWSGLFAYQIDLRWRSTGDSDKLSHRHGTESRLLNVKIRSVLEYAKKLLIFL